MTTNTNHLSENINFIHLESNSKIWMTFFEWLASVPNFTLNRVEIRNTNNNRLLPEIGSEGLFTPSNLVMYRDVAVKLSLSIINNMQYFKARIDDKGITSVRKLQELSEFNYAPSFISSEYNIELENIQLEERTGEPLNKEQVISMFCRKSYKYFGPLYCSFNLKNVTPEVIVDEMEIQYNKIAKAKLSLDKNSDKMYNKYLKNRYPRVVALVQNNTLSTMQTV